MNASTITNANKYKRTKYACYTTNIAMSVVACLSPLLFLTFREQYGISYTLCGLLVAINFCSQLTIDLIFSFFSKYFNPKTTIRLTPLLTVIGFLIYALVPLFFPQIAYLGLVLGTIVFSVSSGLNEVLNSPIFAAIPAENPEREMSKLHSSYAWGVVGVVLLSALYLFFVGDTYWQFMILLWCAVPLAAFLLFAGANIPDVESAQKESEEQSTASAPLQEGKAKKSKPAVGFFLFILCIFLGGAAENTMTQWISTYIESALGIPKLWGDVFGMALFAVMLGLGRTLYAKFGKDISSVLLLGFIGSIACYLVAGLSPNGIVGLIACVVSGICVSMLWPGTLIMMAEFFPKAGVVAYALLAAGGDLGGSVAPQLMGVLADMFGLNIGMIVSSLFPIMGAILLLFLRKKKSAK